MLPGASLRVRIAHCRVHSPTRRRVGEGEGWTLKTTCLRVRACVLACVCAPPHGLRGVHCDLRLRVGLPVCAGRNVYGEHESVNEWERSCSVKESVKPPQGFCLSKKGTYSLTHTLSLSPFPLSLPRPSPPPPPLLAGSSTRTVKHHTCDGPLA